MKQETLLGQPALDRQSIETLWLNLDPQTADPEPRIDSTGPPAAPEELWLALKELQQQNRELRSRLTDIASLAGGSPHPGAPSSPDEKLRPKSERKEARPPRIVNPDGSVWGRLVGVATGKDGSLLFSDDAGGRIYRVAYVGK